VKYEYHYAWLRLGDLNHWRVGDIPKETFDEDRNHPDYRMIVNEPDFYVITLKKQDDLRELYWAWKDPS
jgi:hypothetical protein